MEATQTFEIITPAQFDEILHQYAETVPEKLAKLDEQRYNMISKSVKEQSVNPSLTKDQVATLVDWKLSHGKFRPTLKGLVQQNDDSVVEKTTSEGFKAFTASKHSAKASLATLTKLKGIGPATASLLLSVYAPDTAPFFSDELFRWCFFDGGKGQGWDRDIKYNMKEYLELFEKVQTLRERFRDEHERDVPAVEIEKVAYVLGKRAAGAVDGSSAKAGGPSKKRKATDDQDVAPDEAKAAKGASAGKSGGTTANTRTTDSHKSKRGTKS